VVVDTCVVREPSPFRGEECQRRSIPGSCNPPYDCFSDVDKPVCGSIPRPLHPPRRPASLPRPGTLPHPSATPRAQEEEGLRWPPHLGQGERRTGPPKVRALPRARRSSSRTQHAAGTGAGSRALSSLAAQPLHTLRATRCVLRAAFPRCERQVIFCPCSHACVSTGRRRAMSIPRRATTTSSSTSVKPPHGLLSLEIRVHF
jgi:hypothetical protein